MNTETDFNALHDHGGATFAAVYFVDEGERGGGREIGGTGSSEKARAGASEPTGEHAHTEATKEGTGTGSVGREDVNKSDEGGPGDTGAAAIAYAGALLLKFQPEAWKHAFTFLRIRPRAGELWIFPGAPDHIRHGSLHALARP